MAPMPVTPRPAQVGRPRGRGRGASSIGRVRKATDAPASEPPQKKRRYVPGGPGGGGRFVYDDGTESPLPIVGPATTARRPRVPRPPSSATLPAFPRREPSSRIRTAVNRDELEDMQYSSAAAVAAAVVQSEGYKPREERGWEEFHSELDIEGTFIIFHADDVDGIVKSNPSTPAAQPAALALNGTGSPSKEVAPAQVEEASTQATTVPGAPDTPSRRRPSRPTRESVSLYATRFIDLNAASRIPKVLPIHNQTPKERLDLKLPSYRKTDRILLFESKTFGQARYVEKSMMNVGYQESDYFPRPDRMLLKASDANADEEAEHLALTKADGEPAQPTGGAVGRVEYDMDEQDDMWLEKLNEQRKESELDPITREVFEISITKIEKEWHALEKRIPKPNPKPPQTHRPRSSSAAAVNGEPQPGEEQDSKCAICDDGDCENTNAIVFCDGCDLAVHQECYGVPFIPEGQWLCRKCQLIGRGIPTCIFCPNTDGAFKQTNSSKWAHLLCAMWIPEVSLGNHTFMEPVMEVEKVPRTRWKLTCYICNQRMGACIQCSNKSCYQAFHVTCARRCRLYLKMKNSQGALAVLDGSIALKAYCDKHCPPEYAKENAVHAATREAKRFYKRTMKGRIWASSHSAAAQMAASHQHAVTEHPPDESQMTGAKLSATMGDKKKGQPERPMWKLPSGAPIIPQAVYDLVESALQRFPVRKRKDFVAEACRYWTLKREARRGAALLKRLQLQMETFSSMELTRRNFAAMGPPGKARLARRVEFAQTLIQDLEQLQALSEEVVQREASKLSAAEMEQDFVDTCYFPVSKLLLPIVEKALALDKDVFTPGLTTVQEKLEQRYYTNTLDFARELGAIISAGINTHPPQAGAVDGEAQEASPKAAYAEAKDRKRLGKRLLKAVQPQLESTLKAETDITNQPLEALQKELEEILEGSLEVAQPSIVVSRVDKTLDNDPDVVMTDAPEEAQIIVRDLGRTQEVEGESAQSEADVDHASKMDVEEDVQQGAMEEGAVATAGSIPSSSVSVAGDGVTGKDASGHLVNGTKEGGSLPALNGLNSSLHPPHSGPLTPPQSNGSLGHDQADMLNEGGMPWYLKGFELQGTTAVEEQWNGRDAVRSLSEELTDMDDEALRDLEFDVDDETITASPHDTPATSSAKKRANPAKFRKGVRSSTRKR